MTRTLHPAEAAFAQLSAKSPPVSGEELAADVLAAAVISCIGADAAVAKQARALLTRVKQQSGANDAQLMTIAEARLETLLAELAATQLEQ